MGPAGQARRKGRARRTRSGLHRPPPHSASVPSRRPSMAAQGEPQVQFKVRSRLSPARPGPPALFPELFIFSGGGGGVRLFFLFPSSSFSFTFSIRGRGDAAVLLTLLARRM